MVTDMSSELFSEGASRRNLWTEDQIEELKRLSATTLSNTAIARQLGKAEVTVKRKRKELGIRKPRLWSEEEITRLREFVNRGLSVRRIAAELGKTEYPVQTMCRRLGLTLPTRNVQPRPWSEEDDAHLTRLRAEGKTQAQIAVALDRTAAAIKHRLRELGNPKRRDGSTPWTHEEDDALRRLTAQGQEVKAIADVLNRTQGAIGKRRWKLALRKPSDVEGGPIDIELVKREAEALWSEGVIPTQDNLAGRLRVHRRRVRRGFVEWKRTCGRSATEISRGPLAKTDIYDLRSLLAGPIANAPLTCFDPSNDGRWKEPSEKQVLYLSKIGNPSLRNTLSLYALLMADRHSFSLYTRLTQFNKMWGKLLAELGRENIAEIDPDDIIFKVRRRQTGHSLNDHQRDDIIQLWTVISNAQRDYLDTLNEEQQRAIRPFCIRQIMDHRKLAAERHWKMKDDARRERVKGLTDHVHGSFHRIRFAATVRMNAVKRMFEATQRAIAHAREKRPELPYAYSYEEIFVDINGRATNQRVLMELWDFRSVFDEAVGQGYATTDERMAAFERGRAPFDHPYYIPRYVRTETEDGMPTKDLWLLEFLEFDVFTNARPGTTAHERKEEFNRRWGYHEGMTWNSKTSLITWDSDKWREIRFLVGKGYKFINVDGYYLLCLFANLTIRIQTVTGARLGEVQQVAATKECILLLENVGPKKRSRWVLRLVPKGHKERSSYYIDDDTKDVLMLVVAELRRKYAVKQLPVVKAQYPKTPPDRYVFQVDHATIHQDGLNIMVRVLLHGVVINPETGKVVELKSHALRHAFATELASLGVGIDVIRELLKQKNVEVTKYYAKPTKAMVQNAAEVIFVSRLDVEGEARRGPREVQRMLEDAEGKIGALTEVLGGTCVVGNMCPGKFACIGCAGNAPDPEKRHQVMAKKEWALTQKTWAKEQGLRAEERQMEHLVADCDLMLSEMSLIQIARLDAKQSAKSGDVGVNAEEQEKNKRSLMELVKEIPSEP